MGRISCNSSLILIEEAASSASRLVIVALGLQIMQRARH